MLRWILRIVWLALTVLLAIWVGEGLFGVDQSSSVLPWADDSETSMIFVGVAWGILLMLGGFLPTKSIAAGRSGTRSEIAVAQVIETRRTGTTINDVPQYDVFFDVTPTSGEPFVSSLRSLFDAADIAAVQPGSLFPVRYDPENLDRVEIADPEDPSVRRLLLEWRIAKGLIPPDLVDARSRGISQPASVRAMTPTGVRREGNVELEVTLLITPEDGTPAREETTTVFVRPEALGHVQVGAPVYAMYEPERPDRVAMTIIREEPLR
ncbi:hypothetical protein [Microbacterium sp. gxy059]|uniref:hypothetical protein n=1 Tax=Microbacterium sp. gxy059 TaxID=2957199 RepID=UPI003D95329A